MTRFECPASDVRWHPYADLFPWIEGSDFDAFVEDIRVNGIHEPIVMFEGQVLDGRNRYMAARHLGIEYPVTDYEGADPLAFVLSHNLARRHMTESQRGMVHARIAKLPKGVRSDTAIAVSGMTQEQASAVLNVSADTGQRARKVIDAGVPELVAAVDAGTLSVSAAADIATLPKAEQAEIVARGEKEILAVAKDIRAKKRVKRFDRVSANLATLSEQSKPLPTGQKFPIVYADPATRYVSGFDDRSIENHYPTMTTEELCVLPVGDLALDSAVLFVWSTIPQLRNTMSMIEAWGFNYVSAWCWDKEIHGTGHWAFNEHEELLIATRGDFPAPIPGTQPRSLRHEKKTDHSVKPDWFAEQIERIWPTLPKIELFARSPRPGWAAWGNEAASSEAAE